MMLTMSNNFYLKQGKKIYIFSALLIFCGAVFVRLYGLGDYYFSSDDMWHLVIARKESLWEVIQHNFQEEIHPPLSYIIWFLMMKISHNEYWLRSFSIIPGLMLIPSSYILGKLYMGYRVGFVMALVAAFGCLLITVGVSVRAYSMLLLSLSWACIVVEYYRNTQESKYLIYYFILTFIAIELHHSAALVIFSFGILLAIYAYNFRQWRALIAIAIGHMLLAILVVGYKYILNTYYGFDANYTYFLAPDGFASVIQYVLLLATSISNILPFGDNIIVQFFSALLPFLVFPLFINQKNWKLLHLTFTPIILLCVLDYMRVYPFSGNERNNMFLYISYLMMVGCIVQNICNLNIDLNRHSKNSLGAIWRNPAISWIAGFCIIMYKYFPSLILVINRKNIKLCVLILLPIFLCWYSYNVNFYRHQKPGSREFFTSNFTQYLPILDQHVKQNDIVVTGTASFWEIRYYFPGLQRNDVGYVIPSDKFDYRMFVNDASPIIMGAFYDLHSLKRYLNLIKENGYFENVDTVWILNKGLYISVLYELIHPDFFALKDSSTRCHYCNQAKQSVDNLSWLISSSDEVQKIYVSDKFPGDSNFLLLGMTPQFIEKHILSKEFIDTYKERSNLVLRKNKMVN